MKQYLEIGKIVAVQGLKGEVRVEAWCDSPEFLCEFDTLYFAKGKTAIEIERARRQKNIVIMKMKGIDTVEQATELRGKVLYMNRDDVSLDEGCYFVQDLIGLDVVDVDTNESYGTLAEVMPTPANDVYIIKKDDKEWLIPAIPDVIEKTDIANGKLIIRKMEGLFE